MPSYLEVGRLQHQLRRLPRARFKLRFPEGRSLHKRCGKYESRLRPGL